MGIGKQEKSEQKRDDRGDLPSFFDEKRAIPEKNTKNIIFLKKSTCNVKKSMIFFKGCGMIAMKREVAAHKTLVVAGFPWSECQVRKLATSHCTI